MKMLLMLLMLLTFLLLRQQLLVQPLEMLQRASLGRIVVDLLVPYELLVGAQRSLVRVSAADTGRRRRSGGRVERTLSSRGTGSGLR